MTNAAAKPLERQRLTSESTYMKKPGRKKSKYDAIIIGAGSIGTPIALALAREGKDVLVIDKGSSTGQGENKHAIGGIRATHSDRSKIVTAMRSLEIVSSWTGLYGDDIEWQEGGYLFVVYKKKDKNTLTKLLPYQRSYGLEIDWIESDMVMEHVPGINPKGLLGGIYSPHDGIMSPLLILNAYARRCIQNGVEFRYNEKVTGINIKGKSVVGVKTNKDEYKSDIVINAAGAYARDIAKMVSVDVPIQPESHEAGITEPVKPFFRPMVVDMRPAPGSKNYYFYQNVLGQIVFCITPDPPIFGTDIRDTSVFLPQVAKRMINLMPRLQNIKIRRTWRGLYPMSPDAQPIVDEVKNVKGFIIAGGMCGQGLMLGPGIGELVTRMIINKLTLQDQAVLEGFSLYRDFSKTEVFK
jgi:sarcosine oxidase subunit beta